MKIFHVIEEKRYTAFKRRYSNEYHCDGRRVKPDQTQRYATLQSARQRATHAIDMGFCTTVRIFDHKLGAYVYTYKASVSGSLRHPGYVR